MPEALHLLEAGRAISHRKRSAVWKARGDDMVQVDWTFLLRLPHASSPVIAPPPSPRRPLANVQLVDVFSEGESDGYYSCVKIPALLVTQKGNLSPSLRPVASTVPIITWIDLVIKKMSMEAPLGRLSKWSTATAR